MTHVEEIKALQSVLEEKLQPGWITRSGFSDELNHVLSTLEKDVKHVEKSARFILTDHGDIESQTRQTIALFREWVLGGTRPSLTAICFFAMDAFGVTDPKLRNLVLTASLLGEIENTNPYHSNMHFVKVTFQMIRMISEHQDIYEDTSRILKEEQIAVMLATSCIHDLGHDGKGNTFKGRYIPHRLEKNSFDIIKPVFEGLGASDEMLDTIHLMLICTDVTPLNDPTNTVNQLKAAYCYHFLGDNKKLEGLNLDRELSALEDSPDLAMMCLMMHEADIATSAGLHYNVTKYETSLLMQEIGSAAARPLQILNFLNEICNRRMLTEVGQQLFAANLARIYALAEQDFHNGNLPYPRPEYSDFLLGIKDRDLEIFQSPGQTLN